MPLPESPPTPRLAQPDSLDDLLLYRMSRLPATASSMVVRLCEGRFGITRREWRVLALLANDEGLQSSQLADKAQLDRARTSRAVTSLVAKGLLSRRAVPGDRRQVTLALSPQGRALYKALFPLVTQINHDLLGTLSQDRVADLDASLDLLQAQGDQMLAQAELPKADRRRGGRSHRAMG
jgi:DNA-binding MarR family transcriptional regulator